GVGGGPPVTSKNAALIGPQAWKPWKSLTPRPLTKITWRPTDRLAVLMVASTPTTGEFHETLIGRALPPAEAGVPMSNAAAPTLRLKALFDQAKLVLAVGCDGTPCGTDAGLVTTVLASGPCEVR